MPPCAPRSKSVADGVYTAEQAKRGATLYGEAVRVVPR